MPTCALPLQPLAFSSSGDRIQPAAFTGADVSATLSNEPTSFSCRAPIVFDAPQLKVNLFNGDGDKKVGSLLSQTISPVPEPQAYAMLAGGLAVFGAVARRRKVKGRG